MQKLLLATRNRKKCEELQALLVDTTCKLLSVDEVGKALPEVVEDGLTFVDNARKKAIQMAQASGLMTLADDSGLEVRALNGAPGVYSARYAGTPCSDIRNNEKLLGALAGMTDRTARFRCVIALASPDGVCATVEGICQGQIGWEAHGAGGFGYDPLFIPNGFSRRFAELSPQEKQAISHRGQALRAALAAWYKEGSFLLPC